MKTIKTIGILGVIAMFALAAFALSAPAVQNTEQTIDISAPVTDKEKFGINLKYDGYVSVIKYEALTGKTTVIEQSKHNLQTNIGKNFLKGKLNGSDVAVANNLSSVSLSADNGAGIAATDAILASEITINGLQRNGTATWSNNGTGGFNYTANWTATASQSVASTGLQWSSIPNSGGNLYGAVAISEINLLINDKLTIIWQIVYS